MPLRAHPPRARLHRRIRRRNEAPGANAASQFNGAEKRRSPRYKCEGSAELRKEGCDVRTWATFTDISVHGCYVEAQATYPAGTCCNMKLEANGIRVETKGNVRVCIPILAWASLSSTCPKRTRLACSQMLATISHPTVIMGPGIASSLPSTDPLVRSRDHQRPRRPFKH